MKPNTPHSEMSYFVSEIIILVLFFTVPIWFCEG